jgi:large subunit ribosomal protein L7/L12
MVPWSSLECSPSSHDGEHWFKSSRDYCFDEAIAMSTRTWTPAIVEIGDRIVALTVAEATMLSDYLEEVHGIKADASLVVAPPPKPDVIVSPPEPTEFSVVLEGFEAAKKIGVIKTVRENTSLGLKDSRDLVDAVPKTVKERLPKAEAEKLKAQLEAAGAKVSLKPVVE